LIFLARQYPPYLEVCRTETFLSALQTWDTGHYLFLAQEGYQPILVNRNAFPPLLPLLMRLFSPFFLGDVFWAGIVLANLFSLAAMFYFYRFVAERYSPQTAFVAGLFLLAFPTAFYLSFIYTESLFLLLVIIAFYALDKRRLAPVLVVGLLLPLTRMVGLLTAIPLIFQIMFTTRYASQLSKKLKASALVGGSFGAGFLLYLALMQYYTG
jgi:Gpi18-like mannosyltransferase